MTFPDLSKGQVLTNEEIRQKFKCSTMAGMCYATRTSSLVIFTDPNDCFYHDRWINNVFHYTGTGQKGDQTKDTGPNKILAESNSNEVSVYLFSKDKPNVNTYVGQVVLVEDPYNETQLDVEKKPRLVWVFPLRTASGDGPLVISKEDFESKQEKARKKAARLSDDELKLRAQNSSRKPGTRITNSVSYERDEYVAQYAKRRAKGICQLCENQAPFVGKDNQPYLETHHIVWLSRGGQDSVDNTVALCPNCHKKMHVLDMPADVEALKERIKS